MVQWSRTRITIERDGELIYHGNVVNVEVNSMGVEWFDHTELIVTGPEPVPDHEDFRKVRRTFDGGVNYSDVYVIDADETLDVSMEVGIE